MEVNLSFCFYNLGTIEDAIHELNNQLLRFKKHWYINKQQSKYFLNQKLSQSNKEIVLQIDFAENFAVFHQDEVQAAHFGYDQITIFTACAWHKSQAKSMVIISDSLLHDKFAVWVFLQKIIEHLKEEFPDTQKISIFSDGCASQFKNRFILTSLPLIEKNNKIKVTWSFFATSHGKGAVDGIGGTIKRIVWQAIKARKIQITSAKDFAKYASKVVKQIQIFYIDKEKIDDCSSEFKNICSTARPIPSLLNLHFFKVEDKLIYDIVSH